jgi:hypothetical protein
MKVLGLRELQGLPFAGADVADVAFQMANLACRETIPVRVRFNGIELVAKPGDCPHAIEARYWRESKQRAGSHDDTPPT